jgi:putative glutathione S-transferase
MSGSIIRSDRQGGYDRIPRTFLDTIDSDHPVFQPESGRYHLYVSYACPWAHRTLIYRELKDLAPHISVNVVHPDMLDRGWSFDRTFDGATGDTEGNRDFLYQLYQQADPEISTSVTVPVLWDKRTGAIVNNESSQIIRIFNSAFDSLTGNNRDLYPEAHRAEIDQWNDRIYHTVNNGVYRAGFATTQNAYDEAVRDLFDTLDALDEHLQSRDYLVGGQLTEADLRLIPTLLRFDAVYHGHFKCNIRRIRDYENLSCYTADLFHLPAVRSTTRIDHIKRHYYYSHESINPTRIVPAGPAELFTTTARGPA